MHRWSVVVPVKRRADAKKRLVGAVAPERHGALVLGLALDTVTAVRLCPDVHRVVVVTDDDLITTELRGLALPTPMTVTADLPRAGLNSALAYGIEIARTETTHTAIALLTADLPALRPEELGAALRDAATVSSGVVADSAGTGTTLLTGLAGSRVVPRFGAGSLKAHVDSGAVPLRGAWPTLRHDVDTPADLQHARSLGLGAHTRALLA